MANEHPFQVLFENLGRLPSSHAELVNRRAFENMADILNVPVERAGRCILLRAPRAGHGKTHLLSRIQHQMGATHEFVPLHASFGCRIDAASVMDDTLRRLVRQLPASGGLTVLDLVTRRLFASALQPLVSSGEVPCQDREGALTALRARPIETFDFHHPNAVTAHWARENFEVLGQRLSMELSQRCTLQVSGISFWVDALFHYASSPLESSNRVRNLLENAHEGTNTDLVRLEALLGLLALLTRVVLIADDLEGFSTDETAALRLAAFLGSLRQSVERLDVILSLNQDVWQNAFLPRLSDGLADRLSEVVVELEPLNEAEMEALLDSRVPGLGRRVLERIDISSEGRHARGLIRAAGIAWLKASAQDSVSIPQTVTPPATMKSVDPEPVEPSKPVVSEPVSMTAPVEQAAESKMCSEDPSPMESSQSSVQEDATEWPDPVFSSSSSAELVRDSETISHSEISTSEVEQSKMSSDLPVDPPPGQHSQESSRKSPASDSFASPMSTDPSPAPDRSSFTAPVDSPFQEIARQDETNTFTQDLPPVASSRGEVDGENASQEPADSPFQNIPDSNISNNPPQNWMGPPPPPPPPSPSSTSDFIAPPPYPAPGNPSQESTGIPSGILITETQEESAFSSQSGPQQGQGPAEDSPDESQAPTREDTDRVDDLLRQFRERYGRGSL